MIKASSQLLGVFSGHMMLRELRKIPYLTWVGWFHAVPVLGVTWGGEIQVGVARIGRYCETCMNLHLIFGAENIVTSPYIRQLPINYDDLPRDLTNPFAVELGIVAILVGIAGCDTVIFNGHLPSLQWWQCQVGVHAERIKYVDRAGSPRSLRYRHTWGMPREQWPEPQRTQRHIFLQVRRTSAGIGIIRILP